MVPRTDHLTIRVGRSRVTVSHKLWVKAVRMKAKADGKTVDEFCELLAEETKELYRRKLYPTKFGEVEAFGEGGEWRMEDLDRGSQPYTLQNVLEANLYSHIRPYLMGLALSRNDTETKRYGPAMVILRDDEKVAIVKCGRLKLRPAEDFFKTAERRKFKRAPAERSKQRDES